MEFDVLHSNIKKIILEELAKTIDDELLHRFASLIKVQVGVDIEFKYLKQLGRMLISGFEEKLKKYDVKYNKFTFFALLSAIGKELDGYSIVEDFVDDFTLSNESRRQQILEKVTKSWTSYVIKWNIVGRMKDMSTSYKNIGKMANQINQNKDFRYKSTVDKEASKLKKLSNKLSGYVKKSGSTWYYLHMTNLDDSSVHKSDEYGDLPPATGRFTGNITHVFNPKSEYDTPIGIYSYPLSPDIYKELIGNRLPFKKSAKYIVIFKPKEGYQNNVFHFGGKDISDEKLEDYNRYIYLNNFGGGSTNEIYRRKLFRLNILFYEKLWDHLDAIKTEENAKRVERAEFSLETREIKNRNQLDDLLENYRDNIEGNIFGILKKLGSLWLEKNFNESEDPVVYNAVVDNFKQMIPVIERNINKVKSLKNFNSIIDRITPGISSHLGSKTNLAKLWGITRYFADENAIKWGNLLRKMGIAGFHDHGEGIIHRNEPEQAVFFTPAHLETIEVLENPYFEEYI